jgi:putative spermidine/putrescine transport system permease protein
VPDRRETTVVRNRTAPRGTTVVREGTVAREAGAALALLGPASLMMLVMLVVPLAFLARDSLNHYDPTELMIAAVTPENYLRFFDDPFYWDVLVTIVCLALGLPMAWRLARSTSRWKSALVVLTVLPLFIGSTTRTAGWMILFARGGMLDIVSRDVLHAGTVNLMYSETAVTVGIIAIILPFTILTLQSVFEGIDPRLEEAAASMGAAPSRAFWRIVFPLALPGVAIAGVLCFILCMNAFATPVLLGGPRFQMMAPLLYWAFNSDNNWPFAGAIAFILMGTTLGLTGLANLLIPRRYQAR